MIEERNTEAEIMEVFTRLPGDISIYTHLRCAREIPNFGNKEFIYQSLLPHLLSYDYNEKINTDLKGAGAQLVETLVKWLSHKPRTPEYQGDFSNFVLFAFNVHAHEAIGKLIKLTKHSATAGGTDYVDSGARYNGEFRKAMQRIKFSSDIIMELLLHNKQFFKPNIFKFLNRKSVPIQKKYMGVIQHLTVHQDVELSILDRFERLIEGSCFDVIFKNEKS